MMSHPFTRSNRMRTSIRWQSSMDCRLAAVWLVALSAIIGCSGNPGDAAKKDAAGKPTATSASPIVLVAASTKTVIEEVAAHFKKSTGVEIKISAGPSNSLAGQINAGGEAHIFLSANQEWANSVDKAGHALKQRPLLTNGLVIVVPKGNPADIKTPENLTGV